MTDPVSPRPRSPRGTGEQLADEIIEATTDLLIAQGSPEAVSIRAVAQRVGVTPPSIYLHFEDKDELLDAVCARYFEQLHDVMTEASAGIDDLWERLLAVGLAYVRFATENVVVYRATFTRVTPPGKPSKTDLVLMSSAFVNLVDTVRLLMAAGQLGDGDPIVTAMKLWSAAHGIASLMISKPGLPWGEGLSFAESTLRAVCSGLSQETVKSGTERGRQTLND